jgi:class 3 adenylate cyclase
MSGGTRTVTVLFTDLVDSTALSARLDPATDERLRDNHFSRAEELLREASAV